MHTLSRVVVAAVVVASSAGLAGCSSSAGTSAATSTPLSTRSLSPVTAPASLEQLDAAGLLADPVVDTSAHAKLGLVEGHPVTDEYGTYAPLHLSESAPIYTLDDAKIPKDIGVDRPFLDKLARQAADYVVTNWVDGPALWSDDEAARADLLANTKSLVGWDAGLVQALGTDAADGTISALDYGRWRQAAGLTPSYPSSGPRISVTFLGVSAIEPWKLDDGRHGAAVTVTADVLEPVVSKDGKKYLQRQHVSVTVKREVEDGAGTVGWKTAADLGKVFAKGRTIADLPVLDVSYQQPADGWQKAALGSLSFAVPAGAKVTNDSADSRTYTLADGKRTLTVTRAAPEWFSAWFAGTKAQNFGLRVPGSAAGSGSLWANTDGTTGVDLWLTTPDGSYMYDVRWTLAAGDLGEAKQVVSMMSIS